MAGLLSFLLVVGAAGGMFGGMADVGIGGSSTSSAEREPMDALREVGVYMTGENHVTINHWPRFLAPDASPREAALLTSPEYRAPRPGELLALLQNVPPGLTLKCQVSHLDDVKVLRELSSVATIELEIQFPYQATKDIAALGALPQELHVSVRVDPGWMGRLETLRGLGNVKRVRVSLVGEHDGAREELRLLRELPGQVTLSIERATDADLEQLAGTDNLRGLIMRSPAFTEAGLAHLESLKGIEELDLQCGDEGLSHVKKLTGLKKLRFHSGTATDAGLANLETLVRLEELNLYCSRLSDAGLSHLEPLLNLKNLYLSCPKATDAGLKHLAPLKNLRSLTLLSEPSERGGTSGVTGSGLSYLDKNSQLEVMDIRSAGLIGDSLQGLAHISRLRRLTIGGSVGNAGLRHIGTLVNLESLSISSTTHKITDEGLKYLAGLARIESLTLNNSIDSGANLDPIVSLQTLRVLSLVNAPVTDAAISNISQLSMLEELILRGTSVSGDSPRQFRVLMNLKLLDVGRTTASDSALEDLWIYLPELRIVGPSGKVPASKGQPVNRLGID